jgi:hypothetical protein
MALGVHPGCGPQSASSLANPACGQSGCFATQQTAVQVYKPMTVEHHGWTPVFLDPSATAPLANRFSRHVEFNTLAAAPPKRLLLQVFRI